MRVAVHWRALQETEGFVGAVLNNFGQREPTERKEGREAGLGAQL